MCAGVRNVRGLGAELLLATDAADEDPERTASPCGEARVKMFPVASAEPEEVPAILKQEDSCG